VSWKCSPHFIVSLYDTDNVDVLPLPFHFEEMDHHLALVPHVKVLLAWASQFVWAYSSDEDPFGLI
jgi:hypothetical protein